MNDLRALSKLLFPLFCLLLVSCGFHLRGFVDMPSGLNDVAIIVESANRDLAPMLQEQLQAYHIRVTKNLEKARYWLIIEQDKRRAAYYFCQLEYHPSPISNELSSHF